MYIYPDFKYSIRANATKYTDGTVIEKAMYKRGMLSEKNKVLTFDPERSTSTFDVKLVTNNYRIPSYNRLECCVYNKLGPKKLKRGV